MPKYTVEPGRNIYKDGKPWVYVATPIKSATLQPMGALSAEADAFTREIVDLLNEQEERMVEL